MKTVPASAWESSDLFPVNANDARTPSPAQIRDQLERILGSRAFRGAERPGRFLSFVIAQALAGNSVKETVLGVEVFGRNPSYDPRLDGVVRVEAVKLRARLREYYATDGAADSLKIDLPKGGYAPAFEFRAIPETVETPAQAEPVAPVVRRRSEERR